MSWVTVIFIFCLQKIPLSGESIPLIVLWISSFAKSFSIFNCPLEDSTRSSSSLMYTERSCDKSPKERAMPIIIFAIYLWVKPFKGIS